MAEQEGKLGSEVVEGSVANVLATLSALYPDEEERQIVETVIFPHFRAKLVEVYGKFVESKRGDRDRPMVPVEVDGLLSAIDGMIEENRVFLDLDGILKPVAERVQEVRTAIADALKEQFYQHCRKILAGHGVTDRQSLLRKGPKWLTQANFPPYGKGSAFGGKILGRVLPGGAYTADIEQIADILGFEKPSGGEYREALAKHGIIDRQSLLSKSAKWFRETDFPPYGRGSVFARKILKKSLRHVGVADLEQIADVLGFEKPSSEEELQKYREALAVHGVIDRQSLLSKGVIWFMKADFSPYGKGFAFAGKILGRIVAQPIRIADLEQIAGVLGFEKPSGGEYREALAKHGIIDRQSLLEKGPAWFMKADFPPYGKGTAFAGEVLGRAIGSVCILDLNGIADVLGFEKLSREAELQEYRKVLAMHGVTDRQDLFARKPKWFEDTNFPPHGGGKAFARKILGRPTECSHVCATDLEQIAGVLGFEELPREVELQKYRNIFARHGVADRRSLLGKGSRWLRDTAFPPYKKGRAFAGRISGKFLKDIVVADLNEIADILWPSDSSNEN